MMSVTTPNIANDLVHQGTSRQERTLTALQPSSFSIDDRNIKRLLADAWRYAGLLQYYNENHQPDGDWRCFWEEEPLTFLAVLAELDTETVLKQYSNLEIALANILNADGDATELNEQRQKYHLKLIQFIRQQAQSIEQAYQGLGAELPLKMELLTWISKDELTDKENLADALQKLIAFHKTAFFEVHEENLPVDQYQQFLFPRWGLTGENAFDTIKFSTAYDREILRTLFQRFYLVLIRIKHRANFWFDQLIETPRLHQPHIALFLTFLRLFRHTQRQLNTLTAKHLDYFYEKVLCFERRREIPDQVHLILKLAKGLDGHLIEKGTRLLAGKDKNGKALWFETGQDCVLNQAEVAAVKNIYIDLEETDSIYAAPDARIRYKNGEEAPEQGAVVFRAMGDDSHLPKARMGFALASPQLLLQEGKRQVLFLFELEVLTPEIEAALESLQLFVSTQETFLAVSSLVTRNLDNLPDIPEAWQQITLSDTQVGLYFQVEADYPAIVPLQEDSTLQNSTPWPICKFMLDPMQPGYATHYDLLRQVNFKKLEIKVHVEGMRGQLILQNETGVFDGTQRFLPFGAIPEVGSIFYIGNNETTLKILDQHRISFEWVDPPANFLGAYQEHNDEFGPPSMKINRLVNGSFPDRPRQSRLILSPEHKRVAGTVFHPDGSGFGNIMVSATWVLKDSNDTTNPNNFRLVSVTKPTTIDGTIPLLNPEFDSSIPAEDIKSLYIEFFDATTRRKQHISTFSPPEIVINPSDSLPQVNISVTLDDTEIHPLVDDGGLIVYDFELPTLTIPIERPKQPLDLTRYQPDIDRGFIRFELFGTDFLHREFQNTRLIRTMDAQAGISQLRSKILDFISSSVMPRVLVAKLQDFIEDTIDVSTIETLEDLRNAILDWMDDSQNQKETILVEGLLPIVNAVKRLLPSEPWTPATNEISMSYAASLIVEMGAPSEGIDQFYHLSPFGFHSISLEQSDTIPLMDPLSEPSDTAEAGPLTQGNLFIGLEALQAGQQLSLLFQTAPGTETVLEAEPPELIWSYLANGNYWRRFSGSNMPVDYTRGLTRTGIIRFSIPPDLASETTLFEPQLSWIRASARNEPATASALPTDIRVLPALIDIRAQAILATFHPADNNRQDLPLPLPAGSIGKLLVSRSAVRSVEQPFTSFGGKLPEAGMAFYQRVSERLRHRDRAVSIWDYERLLLEEFPDIYRVKCGSHSHLKSELAPGFVTVAVIPDWRQGRPKLQFTPRFSFGRLLEMEDFLRSRTNLFVAWEKGKDQVPCGMEEPPTSESKYLRVVNPLYEFLRVYVEVQFRQNADLQFYRFRLDEELKTFLAPWLKGTEADIGFGTVLNISNILTFIESREYVDAIAQLQVFQAKTMEALSNLELAADYQVRQDQIRPSSARSILTSYCDRDKPKQETDHVIIPKNKREWCREDQ